MTLGYPRIFVCPLDSLSEFYKWHDAHARPSSTDRRRYAHQPLHRAAFMRTCSYTERFVHREAFTHSMEKAHSSAEPALLLCELLSVFLLPLPDHLPFVFPFPSLMQ